MGIRNQNRVENNVGCKKYDELNIFLYTLCVSGLSFSKNCYFLRFRIIIIEMVIYAQLFT